MFYKMNDQWSRQQHFQHYMHKVRCTYSLTVQLDITKFHKILKTKRLKAYPVQIYMLASVVNQLSEFRMGLSPQGEPGYWDILHPSYTVFNRDTKTFSNIWTPFEQDFSVFYRSCREDIERYSSSNSFAPKLGEPQNIFTISSIPWIDFTSFNLNVYSDGTYLAPIFTIGKYSQQGDRILMPLAMQLHHAACDGYHSGQFVEMLREMLVDCKNWLLIE